MPLYSVPVTKFECKVCLTSVEQNSLMGAFNLKITAFLSDISGGFSQNLVFGVQDEIFGLSLIFKDTVPFC